MDYHVIAVKVANREGAAQDLQRTLTKHGCLIKVRLGLHDVPAGACSPSGLLIMEVEGGADEIDGLTGELNGLREVSAKHLVI